MTARRAEGANRPSFLDRLIRGGAGAVDTDSARRRAVMRDLEWLLNTRRIHVGPGEGRPELERSVYQYGLVDISFRADGSAMSAAEVRREIEDTIRLFEPRLERVRVRVREAEDDASRNVRFVVEAMLKADPTPLPVAFDTRLELGSRTFEVGSSSV
jgi:type VI secretion system protein ImpF